MSINLLLFGATGALARERLLPAIEKLGIPALCFGRKQERFDQEKYKNTFFFKHSIGDPLPDNTSIPYVGKPIYMMLEAFNFDVGIIRGFLKNAIEVQRRFPRNEIILLIDKPVCSSKKDFISVAGDLMMFEHYFIDHYLYRLGNTRKDPVEKIKIQYEDLSIPKDREMFFEGCGGVIADMFQSHILVVLRHLIKAGDESDMRIKNVALSNVKKANGAIIAADISMQLNNVPVEVRMNRNAKEKKFNIECEGVDLKDVIGKRRCSTCAYECLLNDLVVDKKIRSVKNVENHWEITEKILEKISA